MLSFLRFVIGLELRTKLCSAHIPKQCALPTYLNAHFAIHLGRTMAISNHILLPYLLFNEKRQRKQIYNVPFRIRLSFIARQPRDRRIPRSALKSPNESPFMTLFLSENDQALIAVTALDHHSYQYILNRLTPLYMLYSPYSESGMIYRIVRSAIRLRSLSAL